MQAWLRKNGLRFEPKNWAPRTSIHLYPDDTVVARSSSSVDPTFVRMLPRWLEPRRLPPGSRDPLGFQSTAEKFANEILPGLTVFTSRIGYYGFIAWATKALNDQEASGSAARRERFHKLERALALCAFVFHGKDDNSCRILGQRSKSQVLQSAEGHRYPVPDRILKNQEQAGALRLYASSMESNGFADLTPEQAADGLLPFKTTALGDELAQAFERQVPNGFFNFALSRKAKDKDVLHAWGKALCFFDLSPSYRKTFLHGFLLGNSHDAERRYDTIRLLFDRKLLSGDYPESKRRSSLLDFLSEDDASIDEEPETEGLSNRETLLTFYEEKPEDENARLQLTAAFELLSIGFTAIFAHVIAALESSGRASIAGLAASIIDSHARGKLWKIPFSELSGCRQTAVKLEGDLFSSGTPATRAVLGGLLLSRVVSERPYAALKNKLAETPVAALLESIDPKKPLLESFRPLCEAMVTRHEQVSLAKGRQRWCYLDGSDLVKDDLRPLAVGWHAMRLPQLYSLCRDLQLTREVLANGQ